MKTCGRCFKCDQCDKEFNSAKILKGHVRAKHTRDFVCDICNKGFENKSRLTRHSHTHNKEEKVECPSCDSKFSRKDSLKNHIREKHKQ